MAEVQGELKQIVMLEDFLGWELPVAGTDTTGHTPAGFRVIGDGVAENDSGIVALEADPNLNGVGRLTTTNEDKHAIGLATPLMINVAKMGPIVVEARFQCSDLDTKEIFVGLSDVNGDDLSLEDDMIHGATTTITLTASDLCGFLMSSDLTDSTDLHAVFNGGSTTGETTSTDIDLDTVLTAAEYRIVRLEVDPDGTARWYVDGVLKKTQAGAVSTSTDLAAMMILESKTTECQTMDTDYLYVRCGRDWTV